MNFATIVTCAILLLSSMFSIIALITTAWITGELYYKKLSGGLFVMYLDDENVGYSSIPTLEAEVIKKLPSSTEFEKRFKKLEESLNFDAIPARVNGAAAFMVISSFTFVAGITCFIIGQCRAKQNFLHFSAHLLTLTGFFTVVALSFYTGALGKFTLDPKISFNYSYVLAWIAACLDVIGGAIVMVLSRNVKHEEPNMQQFQNEI